MIGIQDSTTNNFGSLIRSGGKYIIPRFQRDYSWDSEQWDDLWQDVENMIAEKGEHYMGYLVLQTTKTKDCLIIDGQQRFTTITILILAAIKSIKQLINQGIEVKENERRIETLTNTYIGNLDPVTLRYDNILVLNRNNNDYYQEYIVQMGELKIRNTSYTEKLMKNCFLYYEKQLNNKFNSGGEYAEFIAKIVDNLCFTIIRVSDEMNAFKVFETLNARGVQLSSADLLKNYLFSLVDNTSQFKNRITLLEEKWSYLTKNIQAEKLPDYIRYYWNSKNKTVRSNELFKVIRDRVKDEKQVFLLIDELIRYSDIYMALKDYNDELWQSKPKISKQIELLKLFNLKQPYSLLMSVYKNLGINSFEKVLDDVIIISFRYNIICGKNPNEIERIYNNAAISVSNGNGYSRDLIKSAYIDDKEFLPTFNNKSFNDSQRNNKIVLYILGKYERFKGGSRDVTLHSETDSVEHILPQKPGEEWGDQNYDFDNLIYRLGNMCLLEKNFNRKLQNKSYKDKTIVFNKSLFITTQSIPDEYSQWNKDSINDRQQQIGDCAKSIWKIDELSH